MRKQEQRKQEEFEEEEEEKESKKIESLREEMRELHRKIDELNELRLNAIKIIQNFKVITRPPEDSNEFEPPLPPTLEQWLTSQRKSGSQFFNSRIIFDFNGNITDLCFSLTTDEEFSMFKEMIHAFIKYKWVLPESISLKITGIDSRSLELVLVLLSDHLCRSLNILDLRSTANSLECFTLIYRTLKGIEPLKINSVKLRFFRFYARMNHLGEEEANHGKDAIQYFSTISEKLEFSNCLFHCGEFELQEDIDYTLKAIEFNRCTFIDMKKRDKSHILTCTKALNNEKLLQNLKLVKIKDKTLTVRDNKIKESMNLIPQVYISKGYQTSSSFSKSLITPISL
ncbi:unnamed protein product [Moneuplotes crassus]|uniref:Uncharacterized protein n=1 Tax=Euplotes crassus TaxID=5936 RepID=A0AAD1X2M7_EUPCR|nr:unnamed protein product [Moneuplotes crassus]